MPTHALDNCSPAINAGDPNTTEYSDARYEYRVLRGRVDIGAYESDFSPCPGVTTVTNNKDSGGGSLRPAINDIAQGGTISFPSGGADITLTSGEIVINRDMNIGGGGTNQVTVHGNNQSRIFTVSGGRTLNLSKIVLADGNADGAGGGAINNYGTLNITDSAIVNNKAQDSGGGIYNNETLSLTNSTVSGNQANGKGAGIYNNGGSSSIATVVNSTITDNRGFGYTGAGVWNDNGSDTFRVRNSIIDGNFSDQGYAHDYVGGLTNQGNNLIGSRNPGLVSLGNYGGATQTHALLQTSPALNAGNNCVLTANGCGDGNAALTNDQRGTNTPRKIGANVDIGAFERNITFDQSSLPNGNTGAGYNQTLTVSRQTNFAEFGGYEQALESPAAPFTFSIVPVNGQGLPQGLTLATDGTISGTPMQAGTFTFMVKAVDGADGTASVQQYTIQVTAPTAATVSISGRVLTPAGRGLMNATVILTDADGNTLMARASTFGYYQFANVAVGQTYVFSVRSKRYQFAPQVVNVTEDLNELNFTGQ